MCPGLLQLLPPGEHHLHHPTGDTVDIVKAFRKFLTTCDPAYREEAVYAAARQLLWNMTQSRPLFLPDFIAFLHELRRISA